MRSYLFVLCFLFSVPLAAQHKSLEYFEKVPTRFYKPGLSPMQSVRFAFLSTPGNQWLKHAGELKLDLFQVKMSKRTALIVSGSAWASYKRQKKELYTIRDEDAFERTNYFFAAPAISAGVSYGFFYPYYLNARIGAYKPWEGAYYKAYLPVQYSDQQGIQTRESAVSFHEKGFGKVQKYASLELYRPFKSRSPQPHPMGWSISYTYFLDLAESNPSKPGGWNFGLYWHIKSK